MKLRGHLENLGVDGGIIINHIKEIDWDGVDWIDLARNRKM
jgi:hypothetical protein